MIPETIYGTRKRVNFFIENIKLEHSVLEFGCGTGYMNTHQLLSMGYNVIGCDLDSKSIDYGKKILLESGLDPNRLLCKDVSDIEGKFDIIIASEVLEHIETNHLNDIIELLKNKLKDDGLLLITVPNGYGWFEFESFLWNKCKIGPILSFFWIPKIIGRIKKILLRKEYEPKHPNSLDHSKHVQRFTYNSIQKALSVNGMFVVEEITGSTLFAGSFSNILFTGFHTIMRLNNKLGDMFPRIASGFYIKCRKNISK